MNGDGRFSSVISAYDAIDVPLCILGEDGRVIYANDATVDLLALERRASEFPSLGCVLGCTAATPHGCELAEGGQCPFSTEHLFRKSNFRSNTSFKNKVSVSADDGTEHEVTVSISTRKLTVDDTEFLIVLIQNVSEGVQLNRGIQMLSAAVENAPLSIIITNTDAEMTYVSPYIEEMTGYSAEELLGENPRIFSNPDRSKTDYTELWDTVTDGRTWTGVFFNRKKDGSPYVEDARIFPVTNDGGEIFQYIGIKQALVEKRDIAKRLLFEESRYTDLVNLIPDGIGIVTREETFVYANPAGCLIFGVNEGELVGRNLIEFVVPGDINRIYRSTKTRAEGISDQYEVEIQRPNGETRTIMVFASPHRDSDRNVIGSIAIFRDITQEKEIQERIVKDLEFRNSALDFATILSGTTQESIDSDLTSMLQRMGAFFDVDRCYILEYSENGEKMNNTYEWCAAGVSSEKGFLQNLRVESLPWWNVEMAKNRPFVVNSATQLPEEAATERRLLEEQEILSLLAIPIVDHGGSEIGFLALDSVQRAKVWKSEEIEMLQLGAEMVGSTLKRTRAAAELLKREESLRMVLMNLEDAIWSVSYPEFEPIFCSPSMERLTGISIAEFEAAPFSFHAAIHSEDLWDVESSLRKIEITGSHSLVYRIVTTTGNVRWILDRAHLIYDEGEVPVRLDGVLTDITATKLAEKEARANAEKLDRRIRRQAIINLIMNGIRPGESDTDFLNRVTARIPNGFQDVENISVRYVPLHVAPDSPSVGISMEIHVDSRVVGSMTVRRDSSENFPDVESAFTVDEIEFLESVIKRIGDVIEGFHLRRRLLAQALAMDNASVGIFMAEWTGNDYSITYINHGFEALTGYQSRDIIGHSPAGFYSDEEAVWTNNRLITDDTDGFIHENLIRITDRTGRVLLCESRITRIPTVSGSTPQVVGILSDMTDILSLRKDLLESERRLRLGQEYANIGTWDWNIHTGELYLSERIGPLFGYADGEVVTSYENVSAAVHPDDRVLVETAIQESLRTGESYTVEHRIVQPDGTELWVMEAGNVTHTKDGEPDHMIGVVQNISDRKADEAEILRQRKLLELLSFHASGFVSVPEDRFDFSIDQFLCDLSLYWGADRAVLALFLDDYTRIDIAYEWIETEGTPLHRGIRDIPPEATAIVRRMLSRLIKPTVIDSPESMLAVSGWHDKVPLGGKRAIVIPLVEGKREISGILAFVSSEERIGWDTACMGHVGIVGQIVANALVQRKSDRNLRRAIIESMTARETAENANRAKSDFLSSMSHELRTPLNAVLGFAQMLESEAGLSDDQRDYASEIVRAGRHLLKLVSELLDLSRIELGEIDIFLEVIDCDDVIEDSISLVEAFAARERVSISIEPSNGLSVLADRFRLQQVMVNLLSNAIKYNTADGFVSVSVTETADRVAIHVYDSGEGIPAEKMNELFVQFNRLGKERGGVEGAGIGLALSRKLTRLMNGTIQVESEVGKGSHFWVELPRRAE